MLKKSCHFLEAFNTVDIALHVVAGMALSNQFRVYYGLNYKRLWQRNIGNMQEIKYKHPATWQKLVNEKLP